MFLFLFVCKDTKKMFMLVFMYAPYKSNNPRSLMMRGLGYIVVCLE